MPACALLLVVIGACSPARDPNVGVDAATPWDDAAVVDAAPFEPAPSTCTLSELTTLSGAPDMSSRLETDGRYVYFISGLGLERAPIDGGANEVLVESAADFALIGQRIFVATRLDGVAERISEDESDLLFDEPFPVRIEAAGDFIYFCGPNSTHEALGSSPFYAFDVARRALTMHTTSPNRLGCVEALADGAYWLERSSNASAATRVMRVREGHGIDTIVDYPAGFGWAEVDERSYALRRDESIVIGARASEAQVEVSTGNTDDLRFIGEHLYFNRARECTPMPNAGNGTPGCVDDLMRVDRAGERVQTIVEAPAEVGPMAADEACAYWVSIHTPCHPGCTTSLMAVPLPAL